MNRWKGLSRRTHVHPGEGGSFVSNSCRQGRLICAGTNFYKGGDGRSRRSAGHRTVTSVSYTIGIQHLHRIMQRTRQIERRSWGAVEPLSKKSYVFLYGVTGKKKNSRHAVHLIPDLGTAVSPKYVRSTPSYVPDRAGGGRDNDTNTIRSTSLMACIFRPQRYPAIRSRGGAHRHEGP